MTLKLARLWINVLVAIIALSSGTLLLAENQQKPLEPAATYGDGRFRLGGWIDSLCFSPDGKILASSSDRRGTALWDVQTGELIQHFPPIHRDAHESTATFSPNGQLLVIAATHLHVRNIETGKLLYEIKGAGQRVWQNRLVQFTKDSKYFLAYGNGGVLFIEAQTGQIIHKFEIDGRWDRLNGVALAPDGSRAILGTYHLLEPITEGRSMRATYAVKIWDLKTGKEAPQPSQDEFGSTLKYIQYSPDGKSLLAVTGTFHFHQPLKLLDPRTMKLQRVLPTTTGNVESHAFTPDGKLLAVGTDTTSKYVIQLFNPATGKLIRKWKADRSGNGWGIKLALSPDGRTLASAIERKPEITLWDTATGEETSPHKDGRTTSVERMLILGDNRTLITQDRDGRAIRRDLKSGLIVNKQEWVTPDSSMAMSHDASELFRSDLKRMGSEPRLKDSQLMADIKKHKHTLAEARISANGNRVAVLFRENRINVYDRPTGKRLKAFGDPPSLRGPPTIRYLTLSADGSRVAGYYGRNRQLWNVDTGQNLPDIPFGRFAPDGSLVNNGGGVVQLWDIDEGKRTEILSDEGHVMGAVAFTPDGKFMAHARYGKSTEVVVWDFKARRMIRVLRGIQGGTEALCFSPDGRTLCASDKSTRIVVWDLTTD